MGYMYPANTIDVTLVALKLAKKFALFLAKTLKLPKNFALFLAKNLHLSFSPRKWRWVHTFFCQKRCTIRNSLQSSENSHSSRSFYLSQMVWQSIEAPKQTIEFSAAPSFFSSKKWIKLRQDPPLEAILVIFGRRALIFFCLNALGKIWKMTPLFAHAQCWSPWRRKNVKNGHLAPSNLTFLLIAINRNGFRRMKEEGQIYKTLPQNF